MEALASPEFWVAVGQIILIDILLGGDNAVVIALACRGLAPEQRKWGIIWGTVGAIVLRVLLIAFALTLLTVPYLKLVGAILLSWIGIKLLVPQDDDAHGNIARSSDAAQQYQRYSRCCEHSPLSGVFCVAIFYPRLILFSFSAFSLAGCADSRLLSRGKRTTVTVH